MKRVVFLMMLIGLVQLNARDFLNPGIIKIEKLTFGKKISITASNGFKNGVVEIKDRKGNLVWKENLKEGTKKGKIFDLGSLENGQYVIAIELGNREIVQPFTIGENSIALLDYQRKDYFTPTVELNGNKLKLCFLNRQLSDVEVAIKDRFGDVVFNESHKGILQLQKSYELKYFTDGEYTMVVKTPEKSYSKGFKLD